LREYLRNTLRNTTDDPARPGRERKVNKNIKTEGEKLHSAFERLMMERDALQQRLTVQDQRVDELESLLRTSLLAMNRIYQAGRDFIVGTGSDCDSVELMMENDPSAREIRAALNPTTEAEPASDRGHCKSCAIEYSAANHPACPICTRTTEAGDIWPAVTP
jgi:hypothetical protein